MKKMTIALFTAAAMGGSSLALAADVDGPNPFGRLDVRAVDTDGADVDLTQASYHLGLAGSATGLAGGLDASYYARLNDSGLQYGTITFEGGFGALNAGFDDDLVYKFAGVNVDVLRSGGVPNTFSGLNFGQDAVVQYMNDFGGSPIMLGVHIDDDTGAIDGTAGGDGIQNTQVGLMFDHGMGNVGVVYSEQDALANGDSDDEIRVGGSLNLDVATLRLYTGDDADGNMPYTLGASVPLNDVVTLHAFHGDDDVDTSDTTAELRANLGGGLDVYAGARSGDSDDSMYVGSRWGF